MELASPVPDTDHMELCSQFRSLSQEAQEDMANEAWVALHMRDGAEAFTRPLTPHALDAFKSKVDEIATARAIISAARLRSRTIIPSASPTHASPPSFPATSTANLPSNTIDYTLLVPVTTASAAIGAHAIRPEIKEHILFRAGYVPLSALTNTSIRDLAARPSALKLEHKPARTVRGSLEKRWIPILTDFIESEPKLTRSLWAEAVKNLRELMSSDWGPDHVLSKMWSNYFDSLLSHELYETEEDFTSILRFDIQTRNLWWSGSTITSLAPDILTGLTKIHHKALEDRLRAIAAPSYFPCPYARPPFQPSRAPAAGPSRARYGQSKPYDRPPATGNSFREGSPICIICARTGHKAPDCHNTKSDTGSTAVAEFSNGQLRTKTDKRPLCFAFNLGRPENSAQVQSHVSQGIHRCSLCLGTHSARDCTLSR